MTARAEPSGLQPLYRDAVLLQQLSIQSAAVQFRRLDSRGTSSRHFAQSRRNGAKSRRYGKVHVLRAKNSRDPHRRTIATERRSRP